MKRSTRSASARAALAACLASLVVAIGSTGAQDPPAARAAQRAPRITRVPQAPSMYGVPLVSDLGTLNADVAFLGVPYDMGHGSIPGTRLGPAAIREASSIAGAMGADGFYDRETGESILKGVRIVDAGDVFIQTANVEQSLANVTAAIATIVAHRAMPVTIGGDHSITFAVLRGFKDSGRKIHIIHLDAHQDLNPIADRVNGQRYIGHGNHLTHAVELPWIAGVTMLGLRGLARGSGPTASQVSDRGFVRLSASQVIQMGPAAAVARIPAADAYYVTIDIDVLDPSIAPATGTPVPGGFSYYQMSDLLAAIATKGNIVGFDITEVSPPSDHNNETALLASYIGLRFLGEVNKHQALGARDAKKPER